MWIRSCAASKFMNEFVTRESSTYQFSTKKSDHQIGVYVNKSANHVGLIYVDGLPSPAVEEDEDDLEVSASDVDTAENQATWVMSLLSDNLLESEARDIPSYAKQFLFAGCSLDHPNAIGFAGFLGAVARAKPAIRYGLDWRGSLGSFTRQGAYVPPEGSCGLTCASFVSELFAGFGLPIVDIDSWIPNEPLDIDWRDRQVAGYRQRLAQNASSLTKERIDEMAATDPLVRLHPGEAAAAVASKAAPDVMMKKADAKILAESILRAFVAAYPPQNK